LKNAPLDENDTPTASYGVSRQLSLILLDTCRLTPHQGAVGATCSRSKTLLKRREHEHKEKTKTQVRKDIIDFLNATSGQIDPRPGKHSCGIRHRSSLVLSTCSKNDPRATVLEYFNESMTLYIYGEPGKKIANIKRNPKVSAVVYEQPLDHSAFQKSIQLFGTAELITAKERPRLFWAKSAKWNMDKVAQKIMKPMFAPQENLF